jgi:Flp pilus assembly protein TadD
LGATLEWLETVSSGSTGDGHTFYEQLLPDSPAMKLSVASRAKTPAGVRTSLLSQARQSLVDYSRSPDDSALLARICAVQRDTNAAISYLQEALRAKPEDFRWRTQLAKHLIAAGRNKEASAQVRAGLTTSPYDGPLRELAKKLGITSISE